MANFIKSIRLESGLNQEEFAKEIGTTVQSINRWENDKTTPNKMAQREIFEFYKKHNLKLSNILLSENDFKLNEGELILYHGSRNGITSDIRPISRERCDFGKGFYLGCDMLQPLTLISNETNPKFYKIKLNTTNLKIYSVGTNLEWAMIIAYYRGYLDDYKDTKIYNKYSTLTKGYDIIKGPIADDRMYKVMNSFFNKEITDIQLLNSLSALNLGIQYTCKTEETCNKLSILEEKTLSFLELAILKDFSINRRDEGIKLTEEILVKYRRIGKYFDEIIEDENNG